VELDGFSGRVALVTGGARGIGREIALRLRGLGAQVAIGDVTQPEVEGCLGLQMDVTDEPSVVAATARVRDELGSIDILVLNAGIFVIEPFEETTLRSWQRSIDVNLTGSFLVAHAVLPMMRESGYGRVLSIGSSAGITGGAKSMAAYGASKAGVMALAKSIASEYAPFGITSNALAPSLIETDMVAGIADMADRIPVGRLGRPTDVADLVAFLCSEHAGFITGAVVDINGGFLIH
jgi:NAD(P)-dependent dehydrogenase (short-subunit alcohol dehydrogenase family)